MIEYDTKSEYLCEETDDVCVYATEYFKDGELVRRDVRVDVKRGFDALGENNLTD